MPVVWPSGAGIARASAGFEFGEAVVPFVGMLPFEGGVIVLSAGGIVVASALLVET